jgi:hypothetical protein
MEVAANWTVLFFCEIRFLNQCMLQKEMWPIDHDLAFCSGAETSTALKFPSCH